MLPQSIDVVVVGAGNAALCAALSAAGGTSVHGADGDPHRADPLIQATDRQAGEREHPHQESSSATASANTSL